MKPSPVVERRTATRVVVDGEERLAFAGCDYLGLAHDERVVRAAQEAMVKFGVSAGASRSTSGTLDEHVLLEEALAEFIGTEAALVTVDGYIADLAVVRGLGDRAAAILLDADAHPSLVDAARLVDVPRFDYGAGDLNRAHALLDRHVDEGVLGLTDGVFPQNGRIAPTNELLRHLPTEGVLVLDDSHMLGVLSERGRGSLEVHGLDDPHIVVTASLGKALGAGGGVVAGSAANIARIRERAEPFVASSALSPSATAAARAALDALASEPERVERLRANTGALHRMARRLGLAPRGTYLPILRLEADDAATVEGLVDSLGEHGVFTPVLRYPGMTSAAGLRLTVCSEHTAEDLARLERALDGALPKELRAG